MGLGAKVLVRMETNSDHRGPGDRGALAQIGVRTLLACDLQGSTSDRQEEDFQRGTSSHHLLWWPRIPLGERRASMGSFSCWDSMFPRKRSPVGCAERREIPSEANAGSPFCAITEKLSLRWTSSQCQRSRSACSTASSSLGMTGSAFCTSASHSTRRACGSCSNCERLFRLDRLLDSSSLTGIVRQEPRVLPR